MPPFRVSVRAGIKRYYCKFSTGMGIKPCDGVCGIPGLVQYSMDGETDLPRLRFRWDLSRHRGHPRRSKQIVRSHLHHVRPQPPPTPANVFGTLRHSVRLFCSTFCGPFRHLTYPGFVGLSNNFGLQRTVQTLPSTV